jgi:hypothetical protein
MISCNAMKQISRRIAPQQNPRTDSHVGFYELFTLCLSRRELCVFSSFYDTAVAYCTNMKKYVIAPSLLAVIIANN